MAIDDFFRARLDQMIDLRHPLAVPANRLPRGQIEAALAPAFARQAVEGGSAKGSSGESQPTGPTLGVLRPGRPCPGAALCLPPL